MREFRELQSPYEREEFIMSLHLNEALTGQITKEKEVESTKRKQQLIYELEVKDKMRKIKTNQQKK